MSKMLGNSDLSRKEHPVGQVLLEIHLSEIREYSSRTGGQVEVFCPGGGGGVGVLQACGICSFCHLFPLPRHTPLFQLYCNAALMPMCHFLQDLNRQVVKSDAASFRIPELDFESPAFSQKGG